MVKTKTPPDPNTVAGFIATARAALGLTLDQFGERFNCTKANVHGWESASHEPAYAVLLEIARASGVPLPGTNSAPHDSAPSEWPLGSFISRSQWETMPPEHRAAAAWEASKVAAALGSSTKPQPAPGKRHRTA